MSESSSSPFLTPGAEAWPDQTLDHETQANTAKVGIYFDALMANPYRSHIPEGAPELAEYRDRFCGLVTDSFDVDVLMQSRSTQQEYNPVLNELGSMLLSLDHNAGVYYSQSDVTDLFSVVARHILDDGEMQGKLAQTSAEGDFKGLDRAFDEEVQKTFSLDREKALALVHEESGWRVADEREYGGDADFRPLEIIRQDNRDKGGWNKYRFRAPTYTRRQDELHTQLVEDGWLTSEWCNEPNYWSGEVRAVLAEGISATEALVQGSGVDLMLVTEGGVMKGTSTAGTDIDTTCVVLGDSLEGFEGAYQAVQTVFPDVLSRLPFPLKEGEGVSVIFFDRASGKSYYRQSEMGQYKDMSSGRLFEGRYVFQVRKNEKGIGITKSDGFKSIRKTGGHDGPVPVSVDIQSGDARVLEGEELRKYITEQVRLRRERSSVMSANVVRP